MASNRWYGSLVNRVHEGYVGTPIEPGIGATAMSWSDRHPYTVVSVDPSGRKAWVIRDRAVLISGGRQSESQAYRYEYRIDDEPELITLRKDGRWHFGSTLQGQIIVIGFREEYYDPSF